MRLLSKPSATAVLLGAVSLCAPAWGESIELLSLGDSITVGVGTDTDGLAANATPDDDLGGYRFYLDSLLSSDFDFVGNRATGSGIAGGNGFLDNQHFGVSGSQASQDQSFGDEGFRPSVLTGLNNALIDPTSNNAAFNPNITTPDAVLLHIGVNSFSRTSLPGSSSALSTTERIDLSITQAVDQFNELLDGDGSRTGLVDQLTNPSQFASDAHVFIALITPRTDGRDDNATFRAINERQPQTIADYNNQVRTAVEARTGPGGDLEGRVTFVDLFSISIDELDLDALASEFFADEADPIAALLAAISPKDDSLDGGLDYVDWVNNSNPNFNFDEGAYDEGAYEFDQLVNFAEGANTNAFLLPDGLHPSNLGAAINAQVFANAINAQFVPEPSALAILLGGGLMMAGRRGRRKG